VKGKLLIVDDNPKNIQVLANLLEPAGFQISFTTNGQAAIDGVCKEDFDLILLDIMMPEMDGYEVCNRIKKITGKKDIPIIFLTAKNDPESIAKGFKAGGVDYLTKPFSFEELLARVQTHIDLKYSHDQLKELNQNLEIKVEERTHELKEAYERLEEAKKSLESLDHAKTEFLHLLSHEIRTPLNGIINPVLMLKENPNPETLANLIEMLDISVKRLEKFSLTALQIMRIRTQKEDALMKEPFYLQEIISSCLYGFKKRMEEKKVTIEFKSEGAFEICGDVEFLKICFNNILENAIHYTPTSTNILITLCETDNTIQCKIIDKGIGFSQKAMDTLFKPFSLGQSHVNINVGLGLHLTKLIMDAHGGDLKISNSNDGGAQVELTFPAIKSCL